MNATAILRKEHELFLLALDVCEIVCDRLRSGSPLEHSTVMRLLDFLDSYVHRHHQAKVVGALLPWLERRTGVTEGTLTPWIRREHLTARAYLQASLRASHGLPASRTAFLQHMSAYVALARWHLGVMHNVVLPIADALGDPREDALLLRSLAEVSPDPELVEARSYLILKELEEELGLDPASRSMERYLSAA